MTSHLILGSECPILDEIMNSYSNKPLFRSRDTHSGPLFDLYTLLTRNFLGLEEG